MRRAQHTHTKTSMARPGAFSEHTLTLTLSWGIQERTGKHTDTQRKAHDARPGSFRTAMEKTHKDTKTQDVAKGSLQTFGGKRMRLGAAASSENQHAGIATSHERS